MNSEIEKVRDDFIENTARLGARLGLSRVAVQLYALLYLSERPLSLDDMVKILKISKGTASVNIRILEQLGAVKKVWVKGSRRDFYEAELDTLKVILSRIKIALKGRMEEAKEILSKVEATLRDSNDKFNSEEKKIAQAYKKKLEKAKKMHAKVNTLIKTITLLKL